MKYGVIFLSICILISSCAKNEKNNKNSPIDNNSEWIKKTYYEKSGALKSEISIKNKKKNGPAKEYYPTGELRTLVNYADNIKQGETVWYYKNGNPYRVTPYVDGKMEGIRKIYYESGKIQAEIPYIKGEAQEGLKEYDKSGNLIKNYPKLVFRSENFIKTTGQYVIYCNLSDKSKNVKYFQQIKDDLGKLHLNPIPSKNGQGKLELQVSRASNERHTITVIANTESRLGNPLIIKSSYDFAFQ